MSQFLSRLFSQALGWRISLQRPQTSKVHFLCFPEPAQLDRRCWWTWTCPQEKQKSCPDLFLSHGGKALVSFPACTSASAGKHSPASPRTLCWGPSGASCGLETGAANPEWHRPSNRLGRRRPPGCAPRCCGNRAERPGAAASAGRCLPLPIGSSAPGLLWWLQKGRPCWPASSRTAPRRGRFLLRTGPRNSARSGSGGWAGFGAAGALGWKDTGTELPDFVSDSQHGGCQQRCSPRQSCAGWEGWTPAPNRPMPSPAQGRDGKGKGEREVHEMKHSIQKKMVLCAGIGR